MKEKFDLRVKRTGTIGYGFEKSGKYYYKVTPLGAVIYNEDEVDLVVRQDEHEESNATSGYSTNEDRTNITKRTWFTDLLNVPAGSFVLNDGGDCDCETIIDWDYETFLLAKEWVKKGINEDVAIERAESFIDKFREKYEK